MDISVDNNTVTINGNIKTVSDFQLIKEHLDRLSQETTLIRVEIKDSLSITSSVIGYLNKLVQKDNVDLTLLVSNQALVDLLDDLGLKELLKVKKV